MKAANFSPLKGTADGLGIILQVGCHLDALIR